MCIRDMAGSGAVVVTAGGDADLVACDLVDEAVLVGDPPRPVPVQAVLERLGFADPLVRGPTGGAAGDVLEQFVDPLDDASVLGLPVQVIGPGVGVPDVPHPASSCSAPAPDSSRSIEASRRLALAGFCSR